MSTPIKSTECYFAHDNGYVVFSSANPGYGKLDLWICFIEDENVWSKPINLGKNINTFESESTAVISPDDKYLFYSSNGSIYWVSTCVIEELKPTYNE